MEPGETGRDSSTPPPPVAGGSAAPEAGAFFLKPKLNPSDLALLAETLAGLVRAKLPLPEAFRLLGRDAENRRLRKTLQAVEKDVGAGTALPEALRRRGGEFPALFRWVIEQGVAANDLHAALVELVREYRAQARFRAALWSQLLSPIVTGVFLIMLFLWLVLWDVPNIFGKIYRAMHVELPLPTKVVLALSGFLHDPSVVAIVVSFLVLIALLAILFWRSSRCRCGLQKAGLHIPVLGPYLRAVWLGHCCRMLGLLLRRRMPLASAMGLVRQGATFLPLAEGLAVVGAAVEKGAPLAVALQQAPFFPASLTVLLQGAQELGDLPETLTRLGEQYEERAEYLGPRLRMDLYVLIVAVLGVHVGAVMISVFLPLFRIQEALRRK